MQVSASNVHRAAGGTRVEPSRSLVARNSDFVYVPSHSTDISKRVAAHMAALQQAKADAWRNAIQQSLRLEYANSAAPRVVLAG